MSENKNERPILLTVLDINTVLFTAASFVSERAAEITDNASLERISDAGDIFSGILACSALAAHIAYRRL